MCHCCRHSSSLNQTLPAPGARDIKALWPPVPCSPSTSMAAMASECSTHASAAAPTCRKESTSREAEEEVEELACLEEVSCKASLARRRRQRQQRWMLPETAVSEEEGEEEEEVWEGTVRIEIGAAEAEVWEMLGRFGQMKQWNVSVEVCEVVEGEEGEPGCVRYCAGGGRAADGSPRRWVKEKLLALCPAERHFTYCILDSSYGFKGYTASISVLPVPGDCTTHQPDATAATARALVVWKFQLNPIPDTTPPRLLSFLTSVFANMMSSLERSLLRLPRSAPASVQSSHATVPH